MKFLIIILLLIPVVSFAQDSPETMKIIVLDEDTPTDGWGRPAERFVAPEKSTLPHPRERDALLAFAGLTDEVKDWDDFKRDVLWRRALNWSMEELETAYPQISKDKLRVLKEKVVQERNS
jgi:hypothetical protein